MIVFGWFLIGCGAGMLLISCLWIFFNHKLEASSQCFHHDRSTGESWIEGHLVDLGRSKAFFCTKCSKSWLR